MENNNSKSAYLIKSLHTGAYICDKNLKIVYFKSKIYAKGYLKKHNLTKNYILEPCKVKVIGG